ncbi:MAG: [NiFe]-hydrogenase assembly chaperone HybE [Oricola sp.]
MTDVADIAGRFEACFEEIRATRMAGIPILNEALGVKAVGGRDWNGHWLGVLVTPWFMNLMLAPQENDDEAVAPGTKRYFAFPAGRFEFIRGYEDGTGPYWMCSLFSPVFEFSDMETAEAAAMAALDALFGEDGEADESEAAIAQMWRGEMPEAPEVAVEPEPVKEAPAEFSRRGFLTARREERP